MRSRAAWTVSLQPPSLPAPSAGTHASRPPPAFRGELTSHHPHFHPGSPAAAQDIDIRTAKELLPNALTVGIHMGTWHRPGEPYDASKVHENIKYTKEDDAAIDDWIADHVETTWHSLGTCAMKPREQGGVVDARLNVYGTQNLKCVDLSICPVSAPVLVPQFSGD